MTALTGPAPRGLLFRANAWLQGGRAPSLLVATVGTASATAVFVAPLLLAALLLESGAALWAILVLDLVLLYLFGVATRRQPVLLVGVVILWFAAQRLAIALVAPHVSAEAVRVLMTYKEGFYFVLLAVAGTALVLSRPGRERPVVAVLGADVLVVALLSLLLVWFFLSEADLSPRLTYGRRFAAPLLLYLGGRLLPADGQRLFSGLRLVLVLGVGVALFGLVERFILGTSFWSEGVEATVFYSKQVEAGLLPEGWIQMFRGLPQGIFSAFPLDVPVRRLVSTFLEPTTVGSFLAFEVIILLFVWGPASVGQRMIWALGAVVLALATAATLSRGAMQTVLIAGGFVVALSGLRLLAPGRRMNAALAVLVALLLGSTLAVTSLSLSQFPNRRAQIQDILATEFVSGFPEGVQRPTAPAGGRPLNRTVQAHVDGLSSGLEKMMEEPLGIGLGVAGAWGEAPEVGSDSTVGTIAAQLGFPGLFLWLSVHLLLIASLTWLALRLRRQGQGLRSDLPLALAAALLGLLVTAWFSESASGLLGTAPYFLFAGWALSALAPQAPAGFRWLPGGRSGGPWD